MGSTPWTHLRLQIAEAWFIPPYLLPVTWKELVESELADEVGRMLEIRSKEAFAKKYGNPLGLKQDE